jgi:predicted nucleic acid-binding protein
VNAVIDTNVFVDLAQRSEAAAQELERYDRLLVSRITWIEFLVGARNQDEEDRRRAIFHDVEVVEMDGTVAAETILIRKNTRLKLPDAIIWATARTQGLILVTLNHRDFSRKNPDIRIPY